ncbi:MFS transporter [Kitasatospora sp. GP82]|uniref:MFS transporter n=1 Tax=Kitasatospora sp. GP82 TaxID=3035089 RepID=UPI0024733A26|nr:MFS transporter [Kitasatospora sp. GP82]MDH6124055.1 EmrB/QacA subfamily drug resistance transporter [Kitasatospora sp. GP82]
MPHPTPPERAVAADPAAAPVAEDRGHPRRWAILVVVGIAGFMAMLDSTVVNVALPAIESRLKATAGDLQWVLDAYILVFGGLQLLGGRMADLLGRRRTFHTGLVLFAAASVACGFAGSPTVLIVGRAVQGLGAALLTPGAQSIVVTVFRHPRERRVALSIWSGLSVLGGTLGVVAGGVIVNYLDWRWAFFVNAPIAALVLLAGIPVVPALRPAADGPRRSFDIPGALLVTAALLLLVYGLITAGEDGWLTPAPLGSFGASVLLFAVFAVVEQRSGDPLVPMRLLTMGSLISSSVGLMFTWAGQISVFFMASLYQQQVLGFSPLKAGLGMLAMGVPALAVVVVLPRIVGRWAPQWLYPVGAALFLLGALDLTRLSAHGSYTAGLLPGLGLIGFAMPLCFVPLLTMGVTDVPPADSGLASGLLRTISQAGSALGMATVITLALGHAKQLTALHHPAKEALAAGFRWGFVATSGVAAASLVLSLFFVARSRGAAR